MTTDDIRAAMPDQAAVENSVPPPRRPFGCADTVTAAAKASVASRFRCTIGKLTPYPEGIADGRDA